MHISESKYQKFDIAKYEEAMRDPKYLKIDLSKYESTMQTGNMAESKNKLKCVELLSQCLLLIRTDSVAFLKRFPARKYDKITLERRLRVLLFQLEHPEKPVEETKLMEKRMKAWETIQINLKKITLAMENYQFDQVDKLLDQSTKLASEFSLIDEQELIQAKRADIAPRKEQFMVKKKELDSLTQTADDQYKKQAWPEVINTCERILPIAMETHQDSIKTKYANVLKDANTKVQESQRERLDILQLRLDAFDQLEKDSWAKSKDKFVLITEKIQTYIEKNNITQ